MNCHLLLCVCKSEPEWLSMNAEELPSRAVSHIQNTAPGPPRQIAVEMPAILPVPTLEAVDTIRAGKMKGPFLSLPGWATTRRDSINMRNWTKRVRIENHIPAPRRRMISM